MRMLGGSERLEDGKGNFLVCVLLFVSFGGKGGLSEEFLFWSFGIGEISSSSSCRTRGRSMSEALMDTDFSSACEAHSCMALHLQALHKDGVKCHPSVSQDAMSA